ncbi:MAG: nucleotidyltransferase domain-containing protein [Deltaproteobacteria bacterium]|nr:nucleotidyltransferase domain-containing protein [Deltaproteobacteria bacterium]
MKPEAILSRYPEVELAFQYGSSVRKDRKRVQDVDIAVFLKTGVAAEERLDIQLALADALRHYYQKEVDIAILNTASPFLAYQIIKHGRLLYDPRNKSHDFVVQTLTRYFDYLPLHRFFVDKLYKDLGVRQKHGRLQKHRGSSL